MNGLYYLNGIIKFIQNQILYRLQIPETIISYQGIVFMSNKVVPFTQQFGIKIIHSMPIYAQANQQVQDINKIIIKLIRKYVEKKPRCWHETISNTLWAIKNTKNNAIE